MRNWSVFTQLVVLATGTTLVVSLAVLLVGERVLARETEHQINRAALGAVYRLDARLDRLGGGGGRETLAVTVREFVADEAAVAVVLYGADRRQVAAHPAEAGELAELATWPDSGTASVRVTLREVPAQAHFSTLDVGPDGPAGAWIVLDRRTFTSSVQRFRVFAMMVGLFALAASVLLSAVIGSSVGGVLIDLGDAVARLGQGELEVRVTERGPKEIERLSRQINRLGGQLEASQMELARASATQDGKVRGRTRYLEQTNRALIDLANRDPLTGLANRRRLELELDRQIELARQTQNQLAVIMMDLDNFKSYNDSAGHLAGDNLLRDVAAALRARTRITDLVVRWGGDEFCILIPFTSPERALTAGRSLVEAVREATRAVPDALDIVGASAGIACFPDDAEDGTELIAAADAALYQVKESGRGNVLRLSAN
jgi:diguanylate cyclase (GGDEF)-like protein